MRIWKPGQILTSDVGRGQPLKEEDEAASPPMQGQGALSGCRSSSGGRLGHPPKGVHSAYVSEEGQYVK